MRRLSTNYLIDEALIDSPPFVDFAHQVGMAVLAMEQAHDHALRLGDGNGRYEVAVSGDQHCFSNVTLGGELNHIDTKQDVDAFLLVTHYSLSVFPTFEPSETHFESWQHPQRVKEPSLLRVN